MQREAAQQQGVADAAKQELRRQVAGLMRDLEIQRQQSKVGEALLRRPALTQQMYGL